jgi:hypothetical protein
MVASQKVEHACVFIKYERAVNSGAQETATLFVVSSRDKGIYEMAVMPIGALFLRFNHPVTPKLHEPVIARLKSCKYLENLARPKRFELLTLRFVAAPG